VERSPDGGKNSPFYVALSEDLSHLIILSSAPGSRHRRRRLMPWRRPIKLETSESVYVCVRVRERETGHVGESVVVVSNVILCEGISERQEKILFE